MEIRILLCCCLCQSAPNIFEISANPRKSYGFAAHKTENTGTNHSRSFVSSIPC